MICSKCGGDKRAQDFTRGKRQCRSCVSAYNREWHAKNRKGKPRHVEYSADREQRRRYGISLGERDALLESQGGVCAICETPDPGKRGWATDHDHATGAVRGILCGRCNTALGQFKDDPEIVLAAHAYLVVSMDIKVPA